MKTVVLKVGGSILASPDGKVVNFERIFELKKLLLPLIEEGFKFVLCIGGGPLARKCQAEMREYGIGDASQHNAGVAVINLNAVMLQGAFGDIADNKIPRYDDFYSEERIEIEKSVLVSAAGHPGHSSDWNTVKLAQRTGSTEIISLKDTDGVYDKNPKEFADAKMLTNISWKEYYNIIGNPSEHTPGAHFPVDILAARLSEDLGISFKIVNGENFENLVNTIYGKNFIGTIIKS